MEWQAIQQAMREREIDAWLLYDFRGSNPVFWQVAGERRQTTRRVFLCIPREGEPKALGSSVEPAALAGLGFPIEHYASRQELVEELAQARVSLQEGLDPAAEILEAREPQHLFFNFLSSKRMLFVLRQAHSNELSKDARTVCDLGMF